MSLSLAINRVCVAFLPAVLALAGGCTKPNPDYCNDTDRRCPAGKTCDTAKNACVVALPDASPPPVDAAPDVAADVGRDLPPDLTPDVPPDLRAPDALDTCLDDRDCNDDKPLCLGGICRRCTGNNDCRPGGAAPVCSSATGRCVECTATAGCENTSATPVCVAGKCAPCGMNADGCKQRYVDKPVCHGNGTCVGCVESVRDCPMATKPICATNSCAACADDPACAAKAAATPACDKTTGACVECTEDSHCKATDRPICDKQMHKCVRCTSDAQCVTKLGSPDPGVCMAHEDGRCATTSETVFVQAIPLCSNGVGSGGTAAMPYCTAQDGITAAAAGGKPLVVMRGPVDRWTFSSAGKLTVVGQSGAKVVGAGVGIRVSGGELYLRGLTVSVSGATGAGIIAESGAVLRMNRCIVENNGAGGISVNSAGFDIVNTVIAGNAAGETSPGSGITYGGIYLNAAAGKPQRFANNTVVANQAIGLYCNGAYPVKGLIVQGNSVREVHQCLPSSSNIVDPPLFDLARPYHLRASSPCVNTGDMTEFPSDDLDGDPRPIGARSDCGADEFKP